MRYRRIGLILAGVLACFGVAAAVTLGRVAARPGTSIRLLPPNEWGWKSCSPCGPGMGDEIRRVLVVEIRWEPVW